MTDNSQQQFIVFGSPEIQKPEIEEVADTPNSGWLGPGPKVAMFEHDLAIYKGTDPSHVAAVNSCTAALLVSMLAAGLKPVMSRSANPWLYIL